MSHWGILEYIGDCGWRNRLLSAVFHYSYSENYWRSMLPWDVDSENSLKTRHMPYLFIIDKTLYISIGMVWSKYGFVDVVRVASSFGILCCNEADSYYDCPGNVLGFDIL